MSNYLDSHGLSLVKTLIDVKYQSKFVEVPKREWTTGTPFIAPTDVIKHVYKCSDIIPGYTKWLLILNEKSGDTKFSAYYINNKTYAFSTFEYKFGNYMLPWELFLSNNCAPKSVRINYILTSLN